MVILRSQLSMHFFNFQLNDYSLVQFLPLDISDEDSIGDLLLYIDSTIQYGEDLDVKIPREVSSCTSRSNELYVAA